MSFDWVKKPICEELKSYEMTGLNVLMKRDKNKMFV